MYKDAYADFRLNSMIVEFYHENIFKDWLDEFFMNYNFNVGESYQMKPNTIGLSHKKIYVINQFLPKTNQEWETFFSVLGRNNDWRLMKTRIPKKSIIGLEGNLILLNQEPMTNLVWEDNPKRKLLVEEWLRKVKPILEKMGYGNSESFRDYFR